MKSQLRILLLLGMLATLSACGGAADPASGDVFTRVTAGELGAGDAIPAPSGDVVLTVSGDIGAGNAGERIEMDMTAIESVSQVDYSVLDPFLNERVTYRGPLLGELLDLWQVGPEATTLTMVALNDYAVDIPIEMVRNFPIVFAVRANGEYMDVADRGPAMLVFPYDDFEFARPASDALWIWQIASIDVH